VSPIKYIPVDVGRLAGLVCVVAPETKTTPEGEIKTDRDGNTQYEVGVSVREPDKRKSSVVINVTTTVQPRGVTEGTRVRLVELVASQWEMEGGRNGISWRAAEILPDTRPADSHPPDGRSTPPPAPTKAKGGEA
jgi:hypothetical protein